MFYKGKDGIVNLDHVFFVKKEFMLKEKKYVILFQFNTEMGYMSWKYETEEERNKEFERIESSLTTK